MEIIDKRRLSLVALLWSRIRYIIYYLSRLRLRDAYTYFWTSLFTRDAGLGLADWIYRINPFLAPYPKTMEVEVTTRCHLKCAICEHTYWKEPPRDMSLDEFKTIVDQFPGLKWIGLTGIGSSFLNKDFLNILRYLKSRSIFVEFFDTFDLIDESVAAQLVSTGVDKIWVSMDAATKETYESIRVGARFEKTLAHVKGLFDAKRRAGSPLPEVWFHYIINKNNVAEMPAFVELVNDITASHKSEYATLIYFTSLLHFPEVKDLIPVIAPEIKRAVYERAYRHGIYVNWNENVACDKPVSDCTKWVEPFVLVTGHVQPCCAVNMANQRPYQIEHSWGNLLRQRFTDIWDSAPLAEFKKSIHSGRRPPVCKNCRIYKNPG